MDRGRLEEILTCFQARARGFMVRNEVLRAREDFEDIVREIDGGLSHVEWRETPIPIPHFTDTDGLLLRPSSSTNKPSDQGLDACASSQTLPTPPPPPPSAAAGVEDTGDHHVLLEKMEAERDDSHTAEQASPPKDCAQSGYITCDRQYCLTQEVPHTPEALRLHRNTLTMELIWLQQAIGSRKKYLSLKDRLSVS